MTLIDAYLIDDVVYEAKLPGSYNADGTQKYTTGIMIKARVEDFQDMRHGASEEDTIYKREIWVKANSGVTIGDRITHEGVVHQVRGYRLGRGLDGVTQFRKLEVQVMER